MKDEKWLSIMILTVGVLLMLCSGTQETTADVVGCLVLGAVITVMGALFVRITFGSK